jgi:GH24 family phage-related lysozyme (muramidase)
MNGRVYDYNVGRFLSVDPFVHQGSQGINPYSYILNNPLAGTDPTGFKPEIEEFVKEVQIGDTTVKVNVKITKENGKAKAEVSSVSKRANNFVSGAIKDIASQNNTAVANVGSNTGNDESGGGVPEETVSSGGVSGEVSTSGKASEFDFSESGVKWLKDVEKERLKPYDDATGKEIDEYTEGATIGIGHLITSKKEFAKYKDGITGDQSKALLKSDLSKFISTVRTSVTAEVNQDQFNALVILAYNIGESGFKSSSALKMINNSSLKSVNGYGSVEKAWKAWNKETVNGIKQVSQGLINRRKYEWKIYSEGKYETW